MSNVVSLHGGKRWKAVIVYQVDGAPVSYDHYFEEIRDLHLIIEHGPNWNSLLSCTVTLNREDDGEEQNSVAKARRVERL